MAILMYDDIRERLSESNEDQKLYLTPLLSESQIGQASIDVRLSNDFIITKSSNIESMDPTKTDEMEKNIGQYQERVCVGFGEPFVIHPNHLVLGSTLEYISMPQDLIAQVQGRSSWGRLGLIVATASTIMPGFKGSITLELINSGLVPLIVYPGTLIAQLIFAQTTRSVDYKGRYRCPTGPEFTKVHRDKELEFLGDPAHFKAPL